MKKTNFSLIKSFILAGALVMPSLMQASVPLSGDDAMQYGQRMDDKTETVKYLLVWDKAGGFVSFPLQDRPRIVTDVEQQEIRCITRTQEVSFPIGEVHKYTLDASDEDTGIDETSSEKGSFSRDAGTLVFENFTPGSSVEIYTLDGVKTSSYNTGATGSLRISMEGWQPGIYLVKTENVTYKIVKK